MTRDEEPDNTEMYSNVLGKKRPLTEDAIQQSEFRRNIFTALEPSIRERLAEKGITDIQFYITGSVAKNAASSESDIDVIVKRFSSREKMEHSVAMAQIRAVVSALEKEQNIPFHISIMQPGENLQSGMNFMSMKNRLKK